MYLSRAYLGACKKTDTQMATMRFLLWGSNAFTNQKYHSTYYGINQKSESFPVYTYPL